MPSMPRKNAAQHGGPGKYKQGCRCLLCKDGHNARLRGYAEGKRRAIGKVAPPCTLCGRALARYSTSTRPFHKACKSIAPQWLKDGRPAPQPKPAAAPREPVPKADMRSAIRVGYEDGDKQRFMDALKARSKLTDNQCWEWQGRIAKGYPLISMGKRRAQVHRLAIEVSEGKPLGVLTAHHKCANSICVNPDHLQPVTHRENIAEMLTRNSLEARIAELEEALRNTAPHHPALQRVGSLLAA